MNMRTKLKLETYRTLAPKGHRVAIYQEFPADRLTPITAYQALTTPGDGSALLESAVLDPAVGRYSYIGLRPFLKFQANGRRCEVTLHQKQRTLHEDPLTLFRSLLKEHSCCPYPELPPFVGGAVGCIAYDAIRLFEKVPDRHPNQDQVPDILFQFYELSIVFNHTKETLTICLSVPSAENPDAVYHQSQQEIHHIYKQISSFRPPLDTESADEGQIRSDMNDESFCKIVEKAKEYIVKGDIFQVVLSRTFSLPYQGSILDLYRAMRFINPSPFMFLLNYPEISYAGTSPERLVRLQRGIAETMPIAGTRPRGKDKEDLRLEQELLADEKENAEHMMLIDLARNDVGSVSIPGSIAVKDFKKIQKFSHVMHITSRVHGTLKSGLDALDAIKAVFPAGTLSGAPKIRAMEIIDQLETSRRGLYGGGVCVIDANGDLESCIAIRMVKLRNGMAEVRAGAGVVYDSDPIKEAHETRYKAECVLQAIKTAQEGIR